MYVIECERAGQKLLIPFSDNNHELSSEGRQSIDDNATFIKGSVIADEEWDALVEEPLNTITNCGYFLALAIGGENVG